MWGLLASLEAVQGGVLVLGGAKGGRGALARAPLPSAGCRRPLGRPARAIASNSGGSKTSTFAALTSSTRVSASQMLPWCPSSPGAEQGRQQLLRGWKHFSRGSSASSHCPSCKPLAVTPACPAGQQGSFASSSPSKHSMRVCISCGGTVARQTYPSHGNLFLYSYLRSLPQINSDFICLNTFTCLW